MVGRRVTSALNLLRARQVTFISKRQSRQLIIENLFKYFVWSGSGSGRSHLVFIYLKTQIQIDGNYSDKMFSFLKRIDVKT